MNDELILEKVKHLSPNQKKQVLDFIEFLEKKNDQRPRPTFGSGKGTFEMMPDFDEPLDDFKEYMK
jgi:hypothetical protein